MQKHDEAIDKYREYQRQAEKHGKKAMQWEAMSLIGDCLGKQSMALFCSSLSSSSIPVPDPARSSDKLSAAVDAHRGAVEFAVANRMNVHEAQSLWTMGMLREFEGNSEDALETFQRSLQVLLTSFQCSNSNCVDYYFMQSMNLFLQLLLVDISQV